jgi:SAM-dependent methyltransferase
LLAKIVDTATAAQPEGRWLDVGGGIGAFAHLIRSMKPRWDVYLNEVNPRSVEIAQTWFGIDVISGESEDIFKSGAQFDVVSSVAVVEHIPTPLEFLKSYARLVKPGGWLITVIPHFTHLNAAVSRGSSGNVVPPFHVSLFNERSLRRLLSQIDGLETVSIEQAGPAAFELIQHVEYGDEWDVLMPTSESPQPQSILTIPYDKQKSANLNALDEAGKKLASYFATADGRLFLIAYCRKPH